MNGSVAGSDQSVARASGWALIGTIIIGMVSAFTVAQGIDINLSADVESTARTMLVSEQQLRAKAYIAIVSFGLQTVVSLGFYMLLRRNGILLAATSAVAGVVAAILSFFGAVFAMNAAEIGTDIAYSQIADSDARLMLAGLQATSDYTSFHLGLVLGSLANAGFFLLFWTSRLIPRLIAGWGVFASLFVACAIIARDFIPVVGNNLITASFMISNLVALVATGLYLGVIGVRELPQRA